MKRTVVLLLCGFLIFGIGGFAMADEISDLKAKITELESEVGGFKVKLEEIEKKQSLQAAEVKKVPELEKSVNQIKEAPAAGITNGVTVGGHIKFFMLDRTQGKRNGVDQHNKLSGGFNGNHNLYLYFSKQMEDWLKVDVQTETDVAATATPSLGSDIGRATSTSTTTSIYQAFVSMLLPKNFELKVGKFNPMFSEDYAKETWWHQLFDMNKGTCSLQAWHDFGAELYKSVDFDKWSLPVYFSVLNGGTDTNIDNNENKTVLLHIAPEFFQTKLRLLGSLGYGKWDDKGKDDVLKTVTGFDWKYQKFNLLGEYIYLKYNNVLLTTSATGLRADGKREGYWIKGIYTFNPKWRAVTEVSYANLYKTGLTGQRGMVSDMYYATDFGLDYSLTPDSTIIGQFEVGDASRSDQSDIIDYHRFVLGWRTTF